MFEFKKEYQKIMNDIYTLDPGRVAFTDKELRIIRYRVEWILKQKGFQCSPEFCHLIV